MTQLGEESNANEPPIGENNDYIERMFALNSARTQNNEGQMSSRPLVQKDEEIHSAKDIINEAIDLYISC